MSEYIDIEVAYGNTERQSCIAVRLSAPYTLAHAIECSGMLRLYPEIDLACVKVGVFGQIRALESCIQAGERVEIYRPLITDPMEARRRRVLAL